MAGYQCPFCQIGISEHGYDCSTYYPSFDSCDYSTQILQTLIDRASSYSPGTMKLQIFKCPSCDKFSIRIKSFNSEFESNYIPVVPRSLAKSFPNYVPQQIREDYEEACAIVHLSPKASAALSRRCLQGMIRDFWKISGKKNLAQEIAALEDIAPEQKDVLDQLRRIGNIGAHPERDINLIVDIEPHEADSLVKLIEFLIDDWYVTREKKRQLFEVVKAIDEDKEQQRKS